MKARSTEETVKKSRGDDMERGKRMREEESMEKGTMNGIMELVTRRMRKRIIGRVKPVIGRRK